LTAAEPAAARHAERQLYNRLFEIPCRRATTETWPPTASTSAISAAFSASVHCRRRSTRATISPSTSRVLLYVQKDSTFAHPDPADHKPHDGSHQTLTLSRQTVRKAIRGSSTEFRYGRRVQPQPRLGAFVARLDGLLEANSKRPAREHLTARRLFELLRGEGYEGAYDSVQRHVREWRRQQSQQGPVFIPLWFAPGEASTGRTRWWCSAA
jgi:hypothetical protein